MPDQPGALLNPVRCGRKNKRGGTCGSWAMQGQRVCRMHGGSSPQALRKAEDRMRDLVHPALNSLERQINNDEFPATKYVLDWAGFRDQTTASDNAVNVTITFDRADTQAALPAENDQLP